MKKLIRQPIKAMAKESSRGVFWIIDGKVLSFPFYDDINSPGVAKSGLTYNHKKLWPEVKPRGCNKSYNYYPRGRVELNRNGTATIYVNPNFDEYDLAQVRKDFGIVSDPRIIFDYSDHYKCYLDDGWNSDK